MEVVIMAIMLARTALPTALIAAGRTIPIAGRSGAGRIGGINWRGSLKAAVAGWAGYEIIEAFSRLFGGDEEQGMKAAAILEAIEDGLDSGDIWLPEPPRGYEAETYMDRLNYFHCELREGRAWLSDNYCKHVGRGR